MKRVLNALRYKTNQWLAWMLCGAMLASCNTILDEEEVDCSVKYSVKFKYDYNMKYADAFANEVKSVTLYAFDDKGKFAFQSTEQGDMLKEADYAMPVDVAPGDYHLVTWAGLEGEESFSVPVLTPGVSTIDDLMCRMDRTAVSRAADGSAEVKTDLKPLFHGEVEKQHFSPRAAQTNIITVPLVKNTNKVRVILQQLSGTGLNVSNFDFKITDDNGLMNYDNKLLADETLTYKPWYIAEGSTSSRAVDGEENTPLSVAVAQLTVGRLVETRHPRLTITNKLNNEVVLSIPLIDYLVMTEAEGHNINNQEYLDRQDEYSMTFFLDGNISWIKTQIIINGWVVRYSEIGDLE